MTWGAVVIVTIVLVETFLRLPLIGAAREVLATSRRARRTFGRRSASDHWKEKASQAYAIRMMRGGLILAVGLAVLVAVGAGLLFFADRLAPGSTAAMLSWPGLVLSLVAATVYLMGRARLVRG